MLTRLDRCTMTYVNSDPKNYVGPDGSNIMVEGRVAGGQMAYCLWGNVAKDPRYWMADVMDYRVFIWLGGGEKRGNLSLPHPPPPPLPFRLAVI